MRVLLIEDDRDYASVLARTLPEVAGLDATVDVVASEHAAVEALHAGSADIVILDLNLPDSSGLESYRRIRQVAPDTPVVVVTAIDDDELARLAIAEGAQDYVVKTPDTAALLGRAVRYALERHRLLLELRQSREDEIDRRRRAEDELARYATLYREPTTGLTAELAGSAPLRTGDPSHFATCVERFASLIDRALEERTYKTDSSVPESSRALAEQLGQAGAGPRDAVDIFVAAVREKSGETGEKRDVVSEEGRLLLIHVLGDLATFYRKRAIAFRRDRPRDEERDA